MSIADQAEALLHPDGAALLDEVRHFIRRFCVMPSDQALTAVTLWAAHSHVVEHFHTTPRLALLSPEPGSGKTRVLEVLNLLVPGSMFVFSASSAAIFRTLADSQTTLLFDECDTVFAKRGKDDANEDLRALLNVGYRNGARIPRCVGPKHEVQHFGVFAPAALAGLGDLPDTIMTRSVIVRMRRRAPSEAVEPFRLRQHEAEGHRLRDRLEAWAASIGVATGAAWPVLPPGIVDRAAEVWEPLVAMADAAGGHWPAMARAACVELTKVAADRTASLGVRLLADLRAIFTAAGVEVLPTDTLLRRLCGQEPLDPDSDGQTVLLDDAPWHELRGRPLDPRGLARLLKPYAVNAAKVKVGGRPLQGYRRDDLWDAWQRYLPQVPASPEPVEPAHPTDRKAAKVQGFDPLGPGLGEVPEISPVPEPHPCNGTARALRSAGCAGGSGGSAVPGGGKDARAIAARIAADGGLA